SGRLAAETSWQRLSKVLDDYVSAWSAMYLQACEATNVRREQSAEVLDLRMSCLGDNLDQVRALTDTLASADGETISHAVTAALDLTPVPRCADVALLKSAVPLPRDERTLHQVDALRTTLRDAETLREIGHFQAALDRALPLRPRVEATGYKPLLGELLQEIGLIQGDLMDPGAEASLEEAVLVADASQEGVTRAKAATTLGHLAGSQTGRQRESERWFNVATAVLDRLGPGHERIRAWALHDHGVVRLENGRFDEARVLFE